MELKDEGSSITISGIRVMTGLSVTSSTTSSNELVCVPLKPTNTLFGFRRLPGL